MVKETLAVSLQIKACLMMEGNAFRFNFFTNFHLKTLIFFKLRKKATWLLEFTSCQKSENQNYKKIKQVDKKSWKIS